MKLRRYDWEYAFLPSCLVKLQLPVGVLERIQICRCLYRHIVYIMY